MKLNEYSYIEEKANYFNQGNIKVVRNLPSLYAKLDEYVELGSGFIFRGVAEAKYKLYNSAQRVFLTHELYKQVPEDYVFDHYRGFINRLIDNTKSWNHSTITKLFDESGIHQDNSLAYLAYMQHFGLPTPLLDFTYDPYIGLFFALDKVKYLPSNNEIDNYFSLYYSYTNSPLFYGIRDKLHDSLDDEAIPYDRLDDLPMFMVPSEEPLYRIVNNLRIINQNGLFVYNSHPEDPLESVYKTIVELIVEEQGIMTLKPRLINTEIAGCFNIHKSLIPSILNHLATRGITRDFIYPDPIKLTDSVLFKSIRETTEANDSPNRVSMPMRRVGL